MRQTFLGKQAGHHHVIFFQQDNFWHFKKIMYAPKQKSGFHFFCPLEKKTEQSNYTMLWKISNLILNRFQISSEPDPHDHSSGLRDGGDGLLKMGREDHFETPSFSVYFFPAVSTQSILSYKWVQTPLNHPLRNFIIFGRCLILALKQAKLQC